MRKLSSSIKKSFEEALEKLSSGKVHGKRLKGKLSDYCSLPFFGLKYRIIYKKLPCLVIVVRVGTRESIYDHIKGIDE